MVGPLLGFGHFLSAVFINEHATTTVSLAVVSETVYIMLRVSDPRTVCAITNILDSFRMWILFHVLPLKQPACRYLLTGHIFGLLASDATQDMFQKFNIFGSPRALQDMTILVFMTIL